MRKLKNSELNRLNVDEYRNSEKTPIVVILDNIRSLNNIGSVFRTADAFRIEKIYLCGITATPPHRDIQKTALGATESVDWEYFTNGIEAIIELKEKNYTIISIEQVEGSVSLEKFEIAENQKYAIILGNEVKGVQEELINASDYCIEIPQFGTKHSFNISVSAGIVLWELYKKINLDK
ncbi:MAG: RNA methyltransferase [Bacteroidetes bacterium GWF2_33_16]|nr:MAG: RNA methyltransferase [Bacteroidetes bacterium GWE2_32_14]OFY06863.1 MAG: RNA methyltransferase [Bacteroidetes bacterium GWF2_33_16]